MVYIFLIDFYGCAAIPLIAVSYLLGKIAMEQKIIPSLPFFLVHTAENECSGVGMPPIAARGHKAGFEIYSHVEVINAQLTSLPSPLSHCTHTRDRKTGLVRILSLQ